MTDKSGDTVSQPKPDLFNLAVDYTGPVAMMVVFIGSMVIGYPKGPDRLLLATWGLVAGSALALVTCFVVRRRIAPLPALYGAAALLFGSLTLIFHDPAIVKMKTTVIDAALGAVMIGGFALGKSPIRILMGEAVHLTERGWRTLTVRFGVFFFGLAGLNEYVWRTQPDATWVFFRMPGLLILTLVFAAFQAPLMMRETGQREAEQRDPASDR